MNQVSVQCAHTTHGLDSICSRKILFSQEGGQKKEGMEGWVGGRERERKGEQEREVLERRKKKIIKECKKNKQRKREKKGKHRNFQFSAI